MAENDNIKRAALSLLDKGIATVAETAWLAGQSRQTMRFWMKATPHVRALRGLPPARAKYLKEQWEKALSRAEKSS